MVADLGTYAKLEQNNAQQDMGVSSEHATDFSFPISAQCKTSQPQAPGKPVVLSCTPEPSNFQARTTEGSIVPGGVGGVGGGSSGGRGGAEGWMAKDDGQRFMPIAINSARRTSVSLRVPSAGAVKEIQFLVHDAHHGGPTMMVSRTREVEVNADAGIFGAPANVAVAHLAPTFSNSQAFQGEAAREAMKGRGGREERRDKTAERKRSSGWQDSRRAIAVSISSSDSSGAASSSSLASSLECDSHLASGSEPEQLSRLQDPCPSTQLVSELNLKPKP